MTAQNRKLLSLDEDFLTVRRTSILGRMGGDDWDRPGRTSLVRALRGLAVCPILLSCTVGDVIRDRWNRVTVDLIMHPFFRVAAITRKFWSSKITL